MNGGGEKQLTYRFSLGYGDIRYLYRTYSMNRLNTSMVINYQFSNKLKIRHGKTFLDSPDQYGCELDMKSALFARKHW